MKWRSGRRSKNVEDRRGQRVGRGTPGIKVGGGTLLIMAVAFIALGGDPQTLLSLLGGVQAGSPSGTRVDPRASMSPSRSAPANSVPVNDDAATFVSVVVADTEDVWTKLFSQAGQKYQAPKLVLFSDAVRSACGLASAASGPFYCPADRQVYLDLSFFSQLRKLGGSGDFAAAYVIAHEVGHHVQTLVGTSNKVRSMQARASKTQSNAIQVKMELQADCLAGLWAHHAQRDRKVLEEGDIEEGLSAASAVGDDHIMKSAGRRVHPESFTHGSSEQRMHWFLRGYKVGEYDACDTFAS